MRSSIWHEIKLYNFISNLDNSCYKWSKREPIPHVVKEPSWRRFQEAISWTLKDSNIHRSGKEWIGEIFQIEKMVWTEVWKGEGTIKAVYFYFNIGFYTEMGLKSQAGTRLYYCLRPNNVRGLKMPFIAGYYWQFIFEWRREMSLFPANEWSKHQMKE